MLKLVEMLSHSTRLLLFSALLGLTWLYQTEINSTLGLSYLPWINRLIQLLIVSLTALLVGTPANLAFYKLHAWLEWKSSNQLPPDL